MRHHYNDIRRHIAQDPKWFDEHGAPRYDDFEPSLSANIYATQVVLLRVHCQNCDHPFDACMSWSHYDAITGGCKIGLEEQVRDHSIHYGDPPNIECCPSGVSMNSVPRQVLQFWKRGYSWERHPALEHAIRCDWADEP